MNNHERLPDNPEGISPQAVKTENGPADAGTARKAEWDRGMTYTQIAESLASHYDLIYYIDCETLHYSGLFSREISLKLDIQEEGDDFFATARKEVDRLIYPEDRERIRHFLDRDFLTSELENRRRVTLDYRQQIKDGKSQYTRLSASYSPDRSHFIVCIENRDRDVQLEQEHLAALSMANELARKDVLTGTKNLTAYREAEKELQRQMDEDGSPFGILVSDINSLKVVNDTEGHKAGDEYIRSVSRLICRSFSHSPVFRIGGDEFVVILRGEDFENRKELTDGLRKKVEENIRFGEGPLTASGLAVFRPSEDRTPGDVFNRADRRMYEEKARLKELKLQQDTRSIRKKVNFKLITTERRNKLDSLFKSFEVVSEGSYVYLCDMKYDFSRWSKAAVDAYGLPSEYMYGAGDIWEERIHPEDREAYHRGIEELFAGDAAEHDMQYRARRISGEYDICTCRGVVIRDPSGEPDYFAGTIRNHGIQGHIDTLTGLRNQFGFFEDLEGYIKRNRKVSVILFGISKFHEINEIYGYRFGNSVLQYYARAVYDTTGNQGRSYRIDGTKFAVISNTLSTAEMRAVYDGFRARLHESFTVEGRKILLDLHGGILEVGRFDVDAQTAYSCLNFAFEESKLRRHGELVEFGDEVKGTSQERLEKLHVIRASIKRGCDGFFLLYQPVVNAATEKMIGAEALIRWKNDAYGLVFPDQFIPVLETDPLFPELGEWIIREAVTTAREIRKRQPGFIISVNLSYTQLERPDFADMVYRILKELEYPPENLCLEVTERCRMLDPELLRNVTARLKSWGIRIALDDFGTGFSSVGIMKEIRFDTIKIDRSFVMDIEKSHTDGQLVRNITGLASAFGASVCAEGVETAGMRDILLDFRVESFQGYYYAKPLPKEQLTEWEGNTGSTQKQGGA